LARRTLGRTETALALLFAVAIIAAGSVALYIASTQSEPLYTDPAAVPSAAAGASAGQHAKAVADAQRVTRAAIVEWNFPGLSVAVAKDGATVWAEGFGFADSERREPVTPRTRFRTGSVSKTMTAAAVALLYDRMRVDLDAPVQTYVPAYPKKQWALTTRDLLGDVGGVHRLRGDGPDGGNDQAPRGICRTVDEALKTFAYEPLAFEPGTKYRFSTSGWILLSAVVEGATGEPFATFMGREIFRPLGMDRTALEGADDDLDTAEFDSNRTEQEGPLASDYSCAVGAGAFLSTPSDLVRLGVAMLKPGLLKADTIAMFQTSLRLKSGASTGFALGWKVDAISLAGGQVRVVRHRASLIGGAVSFYLFPERALAIAAMSNAQNTVGLEEVALKIAEVFAAN
jgi:CubicO group peptidase (beta-lactamase class C family)